MPYGYKKYRLSKGISTHTLEIEVSLIKALLAYVNIKYKKDVDPNEISPSDIREFLQQQQDENNLKDSTINRKIIAIKNWYDFMYRENKIKVDFMPKFEFKKELSLTKEKIKHDYNFFLEMQPKIIQSSHVRLYGKMLYLLYMRGFRIRDMVRITMNDITDSTDEIIIQINKQNGYTQTAKYHGEEIGIILSCIERAIFRGTPYLLSSKKMDRYVPMQLGSFKDHLIAIKDELGVPFRSEQIRLAYVHYLYTQKQLSIEEIQELLGVPLTSISNTLKEALERIEKFEYNEQKA